MFEKMKAWQDEQRVKGEARLQRLNARTAELEAKQAERKAARAEAAAVAPVSPKLKSVAVGDYKTGVLTTTMDRYALVYKGKDVGTERLDPMRISARIGDPSESARISKGRTAGGAVIGTILMPGVGTIVGGGVGALAKKKGVQSSLLVTDDETGATYVVLLASNGDRASANAFLKDLHEVQSEA